MIRMEDYRTAGGYDWRAYHAAQVAHGERCRNCSKYMVALYDHEKRARLCSGCESLLKPGETSSSNRIRCPKCGDIQDAFEAGAGDAAVRGNTSVDISCFECGHRYGVELHVEFTFRSPARIIESEPQ
jgi:DNA-directed RNA polymerase subunit RPC12/RpoP